MGGIDPLDGDSGDTVFRDVILLALGGFVAIVLYRKCKTPVATWASRCFQNRWGAASVFLGGCFSLFSGIFWVLGVIAVVAGAAQWRRLRRSRREATA